MTRWLCLLLLSGSAAASPDPGPSAPQISGVHRLEVATVNAWGLPAPIAADRRSRLPRLARWVRDRGYDLVGLQEVWRGAIRWLPLPGLTLPRSGSDSGLALYSPHPVRSARSHSFREERGFDRWKAKGVLLAEVEVPGGGGPLVVAVTHLQAGGSRRAAATREAQLAQVAELLREERRPVILLGDFNLYQRRDADERGRLLLESEGFVDAALSAGAAGATYPGMVERFDRIYLRDGAELRLRADAAAVLDSDVSDHRTVEAGLLLGR